jgi:hypothetical protein
VCISCYPLALYVVITFCEIDVLLFMMHYDSDGLRDARPEFDSLHEQDISLHCTPFRPGVGPTQPPLQWVPGSLSLGLKRSGREANHASLCSAEAKNSEAISLLPHMFSWHSA